jgi:hypothetical protein
MPLCRCRLAVTDAIGLSKFAARSFPPALFVFHQRQLVRFRGILIAWFRLRLTQLPGARLTWINFVRASLRYTFVCRGYQR